ncbi:hypothetical protein [Belliella aquatica]|uniref:Phytase-like domain-containing protein n=1 Tax=Belliella aquatica TaxID=1323734 RepID=A0ABQ1N6T3_9BACT|nr:hypothetical protein [Belliella aquatica]MCH7407185.1 hypothetical protein [Belliella aquatica]GGC52611.1 hypothetical protein GCM10010993_33880 [Belliella aquatica]
MIRFRIVVLVFGALIFACSERDKDSQNVADSNEWELVILDSIQVDYLGNVDGGDFRNEKGVLFSFQGNKLIEFNSSGEIINESSYPTDGPGKVQYPTQLRYTKDNRLFAASFVGWLYELNEDLSLKQEIKLSFLSEAKDGGGLLRNLDHWNDLLISYYPGRDGANPYDPHFFRDHFLLEKIDPRTGGSKPIIKISSTSRYSSDKYFERPWVQFGVSGDILHLTLSNESLIHTYDLSKGGEYLNTLDFQPSKFIDNGEHSEEYQRISGRRMLDGGIRQLFVTDKGIVITYTEGIDEDTFIQNELNNPKNFPKYKDFQNQILKIVSQDTILSNEIIIPYKIGRILNIESLDKPFYAVRDDDFIGEEHDFITFYKLQLVRK